MALPRVSRRRRLLYGACFAVTLYFLLSDRPTVEVTARAVDVMAPTSVAGAPPLPVRFLGGTPEVKLPTVRLPPSALAVVAPPSLFPPSSAPPAVVAPPVVVAPPAPSPAEVAPPAAEAPAVAAAPAAGTLLATVDGLPGLNVTAPWLPARRVVTLPLGAGQGSVRATVDNWWAGHHLGAAALEWSPGGAQPESFFGALRGDDVAASAPRAPPLPVCAPTAPGSGFFQHPFTTRTREFADYSTASLAHMGADAGGYTASMVPAARAPPPAGDAVASHVRALVWHRVAYPETSADLGEGAVEGAGGGDDEAKWARWGLFHHSALASTPQGRASAFPSQTDATRARYCAAGGSGLDPEFEPNPRCSGTPASAPPVRWPYCNRATAPVVVVSFDCGVVESGLIDVIVWNVMSLDAGGQAVSYNGDRRFELLTDTPVVEFDELATAGTTVYPSAAGHFFNELLPRLAHLDLVLPLHVPLLWPPGALPERVLAELIAAGVLNARRTFVPTPAGHAMHRARRLYVYSSDYDVGHTPLLLFSSQRLLASRLHAYVRESGGAIAGGVVVLERAPGESRSVTNLAQLLAELRAALPGVPVESFLPGAPGYSFLEATKRVYGARLIIGPHGANLNNIVGARPGAWIVELGYVDHNSPLPGDYFCLARNLGLRYWVSIADSGGYGGPMVVNVADVVDIARRAFDANSSDAAMPRVDR